jgi:hypothetical protein
MPPGESAARRVAAWGAFVIAAFAWGIVDVLRAFRSPAWDLSALVVGARVVAEGGYADLYDHDPVLFNVADGPAFRHAARALGIAGTPTAFVHSPLVAALGRPLAGLPFDDVALVWLVLAAAATVGGLVLAMRAFAPTLRGPFAWAALFGALLFFEPIRYGLWLGQTTPLVFFLTMLALFLAEGRRPLVAGLVLAVPAFLKLGPALFVLVWLWRKNHRAALGFAAGVAALAALSLLVAGTAPNLEYLARLRTIGTETVATYNNHSLSAALERMFGPTRDLFEWRVIPLSTVARVGLAGATVAMLAGGWAACRGLHETTRTRLASGVVAVVMLLVPTLAWTHYFVFLVPVALLVWELAGRIEGHALVRASLVVPLLLCSRPLFLDQVTCERSFVTIIVGPTVAAVVLYALLLVVARGLAQGGKRNPSKSSAGAGSSRAPAAKGEPS